MSQKMMVAFVVLVLMSSSVWAQKSKTTSKKKTSAAKELSVAEKMPYARTNKHWGPGTYYCFAPGVPNVKMVVNQITAMRDLTGISREDCISELTRQGFKAVPSKEIQKWYGKPKDEDNQYFYSPDKSFIVRPNFIDMYNSKFTSPMPYATNNISCYQLLPIEDSVKVLNMAWQYLRDLNDLKILMTFGSKFKKSDEKAWPTEITGTTGWNGFRAGTASYLRMVDGKPRIDYTRNETIVRRTIGKPEFHLAIMGYETDFCYFMDVKLTKEGYVIHRNVIAKTLANLEPGDNWTNKHKKDVLEASNSEKADKQIIEVYKKAPVPPKMEDLNILLHTR